MAARKPHTEPGYAWCIMRLADGRYWHPRRKLGRQHPWVADRSAWTDYVSRSACLAAWTRLGFTADTHAIVKLPALFDPPVKPPSRRPD